MIAVWAVLMLLFAGAPVAAQDVDEIQEFIAGERGKSKPTVVKDSYDPLIPQLFATDKDNGMFAAISNVNNTIDIIRREGETLVLHKSFLVDVVRLRHDEHHIYRPKSVAIYQNYVVFLASHRDSCYLAVLDLDGNLVRKMIFEGRADAFSYSNEAKELYIAGENPTGYDVIALDASNGMDRIDLKHAATLHYQKPRMSEVIAVEDPWGIGMAAVAMSVVFLALLLLYLVFKNVGKALIGLQHRRHQEHEAVAVKPGSVSPKDSSGDVYAAITAAIHLFNEEQHDEESAVLTINKVSRTYSPWSSKLHGMNTYFNKK